MDSCEVRVQKLKCENTEIAAERGRLSTQRHWQFIVSANASASCLYHIMEVSTLAGAAEPGVFEESLSAPSFSRVVFEAAG